MSTTYKISPIHQGKGLLADFSEPISPFFEGGGIIAKEFIYATGDPTDGYAPSEDLIIQIAGATAIAFAEFQTATGVKIAHVVTNLSGTAGKVLTIAAGTEAVIRCFIVYKV